LSQELNLERKDEGLQRERIKQIISYLLEYLKSEDLAPERNFHLENLAELNNKLHSSYIYLAVLGQFKRGKSTFINALLEKELLPTGVIPSTSVITTIQYSPEFEVRVLYNNGKEEIVSFVEMQSLITEKGNPGNILGIKHVMIRHPAAFLSQGTILVDTPGTNSLQTLNTEETMNFLPKVDAAIFLLSADQPISKEELDFLDNIKKHVPKIFVVLNKTDLLSRTELSEAIDYCRKAIRKVIPDAEIAAVSSRLHLEGKKESSGIDALKKQMEYFFETFKGELELESSIGKCAKIVNQMQQKINLEIRAAELSEKELIESLENLKTFREKINQTKRDFKHIINAHSKDVLGEMAEYIERFRREKNHDIVREINERFKTRGSLSEAQSYAFRRIHEELENFRPVASAEFQQRIGLLLKRLKYEAGLLAEDISCAGKAILNSKVRVELPEPEFVTDKNLEYSIEKAYGLIPFSLEEAASLLPWSLSKGVIMSRVTEKTRDLLDKNCGRIRVDISENLVKTTQEYIILWERELDNVVLVIESALEKGVKLKDDKSEHVQWKKSLESQKAALDNISRELQSFKLLNARWENNS